MFFLCGLSSEKEDGVKVVRVENMDNPYKHQDNFDKRFKLSLNKLYAWSLVDYDRVVMLDADNLFLQNTDELFQCGQFCAVFINPCVFHTGLFVLQVYLSKMSYKFKLPRKCRCSITPKLTCFLLPLNSFIFIFKFH